MKLTVGDIRFSVSGYVSATIEVETGKLYRSLFPVCRMDVSVPLMEGEPLTLEQCKGELLAKARERIAEMYKEIVCGGEHPRSNHDLEERVALLEERLSGVSEKNVEFYNPNGTLAVRIVVPSQMEKRPDEEAQGIITKTNSKLKLYTSVTS